MVQGTSGHETYATVQGTYGERILGALVQPIYNEVYSVSDDARPLSTPGRDWVLLSSHGLISKFWQAYIGNSVSDGIFFPPDKNDISGGNPFLSDMWRGHNEEII